MRPKFYENLERALTTRHGSHHAAPASPQYTSFPFGLPPPPRRLLGVAFEPPLELERCAGLGGLAGGALAAEGGLGVCTSEEGSARGISVCTSQPVQSDVHFHAGRSLEEARGGPPRLGSGRRRAAKATATPPRCRGGGLGCVGAA